MYMEPSFKKKHSDKVFNGRNYKYFRTYRSKSKANIKARKIRTTTNIRVRVIPSEGKFLLYVNKKHLGTKVTAEDIIDMYPTSSYPGLPWMAPLAERAKEETELILEMFKWKKKNKEEKS